MIGSGSKINRDLPNDEYLAAVNSPTQATQVNPFVTIADLPAGTAISNDIMPRGNAAGDGIEDGTWSNVGNDIYPETTGSNIGDATHRIGTLFMASTVDHLTDLNINVGAVNNHTFLADGKAHLSKTGARFTVGNATIASLKYELGVLEHRTPTGVGSTWVGYTSYHDTLSTQVGLFANKFGYNALRYSHDYRWETWTGAVGTSSTERMRLSSTGDLAVGAIASPNARVHVRGNSDLSVGRALQVGGANNQARMFVANNGEFSFGVGQTAVGVSGTFGGQIRVTGKTYGTFIGGTNNGLASLLVGTAGTTRWGIYCAIQGSTYTGNDSIAIYGNNLIVSGASQATGVRGLARNATLIAVGVDGTAGGGATIQSTTYVAGVRGTASSNLDSGTFYGGKFVAQYNNASQIYTADMIGVEAFGVTTSGNAASTGIAVGLRARTLGSINTLSTMAINVPSLGSENNGVVVLGADARVGDSMLQVTGDIEVIGSGGTEGVILEAPDTTRYKVTVNNAGALVIAAA